MQSRQRIVNLSSEIGSIVVPDFETHPEARYNLVYEESRGMLHVHAEWEPTEDEEYFTAPNALMILEQGQLGKVSRNVMACNYLGVVRTAGRIFHVYSAHVDDSVTVCVTLLPRWFEGQFVYEQKVMLPELNCLIASHALTMRVEGSPVESTSFVGHLTYDDVGPKKAYMLSIERENGLLDDVSLRITSLEDYKPFGLNLPYLKSLFEPDLEEVEL